MTISSDRSLQMEVRRVGSAVVITVHGSASMTDAPRLREELQRLAERPRTTIILDLTDLDFIGAEGIDALLFGRERLNVQQGQIRLVHPNDDIRRILDLTRLSEVFGVFDSLEEALKNVQ
ncbi:MAG TPA: anti-sigma factor antagonist [Phycisphaerae bacterium]|nr:anti-sigma factor antagonist [Phycisphaerae bacterium]